MGRVDLEKLEVQPATAEDIPSLAEAFQQENYFSDRLTCHQRGDGELLVAWLEGVPVANVFLRFEPADEPELREMFGASPTALLQHLEVNRAYLRNGIGRHVMEFAEQRLRQLEYQVVALAVTSDNKPARMLYDSLGYQPGKTDVIAAVEEFLPNGVRQQVGTEFCDVYTKDLRGA